MRFQRGTIWLKSGKEKSPLPLFAKGGVAPVPPFGKGGLGGILRLGPAPVHGTALNATWYERLANMARMIPYARSIGIGCPNKRDGCDESK